MKSNLMSRKVATRKDGNSQVFVDDQAPDAHHGSSAVVQFNSSLSKLGLLVELVPSEVKSSVTVVTREFSLVVQPVGVTVDNFCNNKEESHLHKDVSAAIGGQKVWEGSKTIRDILSTWESDSSGSNQISGNGKHGNASVLELNLADEVELFLVTVSDDAKRIPQTKL